MTRFLSKFAIRAAMCGLFVSVSTAAMASTPFDAGDSFVVTRSWAPLMRGTNTLATLPQGQQFNVIRTEGDWVGTRAIVNGRAIGGWVHMTHVATPAQYAQRRTMGRRYSYQAGAAEGGYSYPPYGYSGRDQSGSILNRRLIMGYTPYGPSYWRADRKIVGY